MSKLISTHVLERRERISLKEKFPYLVNNVINEWSFDLVFEEKYTKVQNNSDRRFLWLCL